MRLLYGPVWHEVAPMLTLIALAELLFVAMPLHTDLPILLGKLNPLIGLNLIDTAMSVSLLAAGCLWGGEGAAAAVDGGGHGRPFRCMVVARAGHSAALVHELVYQFRSARPMPVRAGPPASPRGWR